MSERKTNGWRERVTESADGWAAEGDGGGGEEGTKRMDGSGFNEKVNTSMVLIKGWIIKTKRTSGNLINKEYIHRYSHKFIYNFLSLDLSLSLSFSVAPSHTQIDRYIHTHTSLPLASPPHTHTQS